MYHLFHLPQPRMDRKRGSPEGYALRQRYAKARHQPDLMLALIEEMKSQREDKT